MLFLPTQQTDKFKKPAHRLLVDSNIIVHRGFIQARVTCNHILPLSNGQNTWVTSLKTEHALYTGWSKSLCAHDDYNTESMCTETFWSPCI